MASVETILARSDSYGELSQQRSLARPFTLRGVGLHTGIDCQVSVLPANPNSGRCFVQDGAEIPASAECVIDTDRCTALSKGCKTVRTVEHLLAALAGCMIDNARIELVGPEVPILDGSALPFVEAIAASGICSQNVPARVISVPDEMCFEGSNGSSRLVATPSNTYEMQVSTSFPGWPEGDNHTRICFGDDTSQFINEFAPARTFAFASEVEPLLKSGFARGGSIDNVVVITPPAGFSTQLRIPGEWWRHKVLDLIGDLALADARLKCSIVATRPGHSINTRLAAALLSKRIPAQEL